MFIVDAHLDLAYNALRGRQVLQPAREQVADSEGIPTVGIPDLIAGHVKLICATIFAVPETAGEAGYRNADEAHAEGMRQLEWYGTQNSNGILRTITNSKALKQDAAPSSAPAAILLLEGADPIRTPDEASEWYDAGIRIVGLSWRKSRYAGGTGFPGPLTAEGIELVKQLDQLGMIHDTSHLAEQSFWQLLDATTGPVIASHSNCRSIVPTDRQLSDEMIKAVIARKGVIGINFFDKFLLFPDQYGKRRATLADVIDHMKHICDLAGNANHVAIGTDMDGGLGREEIPVEIETSADLPRLADALVSAGFDGGDVTAILGENWLRFFERSLPPGDAR